MLLEHKSGIQLKQQEAAVLFFRFALLYFALYQLFALFFYLVCVVKKCCGDASNTVSCGREAGEEQVSQGLLSVKP